MAYGTRSRSGFGHGPYGHVPFGHSNLVRDELWDRVPQWIRYGDEDTNNLREFFEMVTSEFQTLAQSIDQLKTILDAQNAPSHILPWIASNFNLLQTEDEPESARRAEILTVTNFIKSRGTRKGYRLIAALFGLNATLKRLYWRFTEYVEEGDFDEKWIFRQDIPWRHVGLSRTFTDRYQMWPYTPTRGQYLIDPKLDDIPLDSIPLDTVYYPPPQLSATLRVYLSNPDGSEIQDFENVARGVQTRMEASKEAGVTLDYVWDGPKTGVYCYPRISTIHTGTIVYPTLSTMSTATYCTPSIEI